MSALRRRWELERARRCVRILEASSADRWMLELARARVIRLELARVGRR